nr:RNA-directed DNA polymerase, eukaryota, reverse transcriptase zinc-binding domain protein [Tanacetum cinerariifolium]
MIKNISKSGNFKYHYGCKELKLTHMCFVDDLMVLCNGDTESLKVVKKSLDEFSSVSGLFLNLRKSTIFFGSISKSLKEDMLNILPFKCGNLPMKYLGIPLLAKRLGVKDCQSLIDNVENRINCWRNKFLSYAGRIQLIAYVLSAMLQYWASMYMLPTTVVNELEKIFKRFLWNPVEFEMVKGKADIHNFKLVLMGVTGIKGCLGQGKSFGLVKSMMVYASLVFIIMEGKWLGELGRDASLPLLRRQFTGNVARLEEPLLKCEWELCLA